jgi:hypothetical protein
MCDEWLRGREGEEAAARGSRGRVGMERIFGVFFPAGDLFFLRGETTDKGGVVKH